MAIFAQDMFNRTVSGWVGTYASDGINQWVAYQTQSGFSVNGSEGVVLNTAGGAGQNNHYALGDGVSASQDLTVRFQLGAAGDFFGLESRSKDASNWYMFKIGASVLTIDRCVAGTVTTLTSLSQTFVPGTYYQLRFRVYANQLMARAWLDGSTEPATWMLTTSDTNFTSGTAGMYFYPSSTTAGIKVDNFVFQDTFINSSPILAVDYNNIIYAMAKPSGATEKGKYMIYQASWSSTADVSVLIPLLSKQNTYVSLSFDTADMAPTNMGTPNISSASTSTQGMFIRGNATAISTATGAGGNWTAQY